MTAAESVWADRYDVVVIGAGPAGVAAAVRVRWLKRYHAVPCKVAVVDPAPIGGLTQMGACFITGPAWSYTEDQIGDVLRRDIERFHIPHIQQRVTQLRRNGDRFDVLLADGRLLRARAVVLGCGMKLLAGEPRFWGKGVTATSMGLTWSAQKIREWVSKPGQRIMFIGSRRIAQLIDLAEQYRHASTEVEYVAEPVMGTVGPHPPLATQGTVLEIDADADDTRRVRIGTSDGLIERRGVNLIVMDFLSYESAPARSFDCGAEADADGFVKVDRRQSTNVAGLFAAGDCTGMPAAVSTAIGEGVVAGFEAYRYVYLEKFGTEPSLFAYYGHDGALDPDGEEIVKVEQRHRVELLVPAQHVVRKLALTDGQRETRVVQLLAEAGCMAVEQLSQRVDIPIREAVDIVTQLLRAKFVTLHESAD